MGWDLHKLFKSHSSELMRFIRRAGVPEDDAPDLLQDAFLRLATTHDGQASIANPRAYLFKVSRNLVTDHARARAVRQRYSQADAPTDVVAPAPPPEAAIDYRRMVQKLEGALAGLSDRQREVFLLHKFEELSHSEISVRLGISRSMVEKHMMRALLNLRTELGDMLD
ncbi:MULTISPECIES: RNA polymerase sigma factor [Rhizobium/Agrobacterium group]|uniref:RNA polymerase sigma factor n=1 Tax=Rhizobium/Agrobacterium group TaxID=227290 RepID=UPI00336BE8E5